MIIGLLLTLKIRQSFNDFWKVDYYLSSHKPRAGHLVAGLLLFYIGARGIFYQFYYFGMLYSISEFLTCNVDIAFKYVDEYKCNASFVV